MLDGILAAGALVLPGFAVVRVLLGARGALEQIVLAVAVGRGLLAAIALVAASCGAIGLVSLWTWLAWGAAGVAVAGAWVRRRRRPRRGVPAGVARDAVGAVVVVGAALLLTWVVVARSPVASSSGDLEFLGRHPTSDTLVYQGVALELARHGLPLREPLVGARPGMGQELFYGGIAGLAEAGGQAMLEVTFALRPLFDTASLALTLFVLARAMGSTATSAAAAALLVLFGGGLFWPLLVLARGLGFAPNVLELWSFGSAFLLPFNPAAPALQTAACGLLLLARPGALPGRAAAMAGALFGLALGFKLAVGVALLPGLALAALGRDAPGRVPRATVGLAAAFAIPFVAWSLAVSRLEGAYTPAPRACPGCLASFAWNGTWGNPWQAAGVFEGSGAGSEGAGALALAGSALLWLVVTWGVRWLAVPRLVRAWRPGRTEVEPGVQRVERVLGAWLAVGTLLTLTVHTPPHFPNAGQLAWCPALLLWLPLVAVLERHWRTGTTRARAGVALAAVLAVASGPFWLWRLGVEAPVVQRLPAPAIALLDGLREVSAPDEVVMEPSLLLAPGLPTPVVWLAGRRAVSGHTGMLLYLDPAEQALRRRQLERVYEGHDAADAARALRESGASLVLEPAGLSTPLRVGVDVDVVLAHPAGRVLRLRSGAGKGVGEPATGAPP